MIVLSSMNGFISAVVIKVICCSELFGRPLDDLTYCLPSAEGTLLPTLANELDTIWNLRAHHFPSVQLVSIHHEGAITDGMNSPLLFS